MNPTNTNITELKAEALRVRNNVANLFIPGTRVIRTNAATARKGLEQTVVNVENVGNLAQDQGVRVKVEAPSEIIYAYFGNAWWLLPKHMAEKAATATNVNTASEVRAAHEKFSESEDDSFFGTGRLSEAIYLNSGHAFNGLPVLCIRQHSNSIVCMTAAGELFSTVPERLLPLEWIKDRRPNLKIEAGFLSKEYRLTTEDGESEVHDENKIQQATIERTGLKLLVPPGMSFSEARATLERQERLEEEEINFVETLECHPYDGAHALGAAIKEKFGWLVQEPGPWGSPAPVLSVEVAEGRTVQVPWGRFSVKAIDGFLTTGFARNEAGMFVFQINVIAKRKFESVARDITNLTKRILARASIYKGRALKVRFKGDDGQPLPLVLPRAIDVSTSLESKLVFTDAVFASIKTNLFTPIERYAELATYGIPFRRGVMLSGTYGVGKSELARVAANKAEAAGISFIYVEAASEFAAAVKFAASYTPAIVFCEDIDKAVSGVERTALMDEILNTLDGILSKSRDIMVVLTTNDIDKIHQAFVRPGRIDAILDIKRPDAKAVDKLMRLYGNGLIPEGEDISEAAGLLKGQIPAVIREVIERAKLSGLKLAAVGEAPRLTGAALADAAATMNAQIELLNRERTVPPSDIEKGFTIMGAELSKGLQRAMAAAATVSVYNRARAEAAPAEINIEHLALTSKN